MSEETPSPKAMEEATGPPTFDETVQTGVRRLQEAIGEFETLAARIPEDAYHEGEARVLAATAAEVETLVQAGQIDFESAAYDSEAWYHIVEDLQRVASKLYDAVFLLRDVEKRLTTDDGGPGRDGDGATVV